MSLSVLLSIYNKENITCFNKSMVSIWDSQLFKPDEIILVQDGPLTAELYESIEQWKYRLSTILVVVELKKNVGLARALNEGIKYCKGDYIARMDTDDISMPERFQKQLEFLENNSDIDVVGTWISEIGEDDQLIKEEIQYPLDHDELFKFFSKRDPIAHPTAMFRKTFFKKAGIYSSEVHLAEDTLLWYSGFMNKCKFANIPYIGLQFRRTSNFYLRRANWEKSWGLLRFRLYKINRSLGYGIKSDFYAIAYFIMSISPSFIKRFLYNTFR